jgi:hypothetical protein
MPISPPVIDASSTGNAQYADNATWNHTVGASANYLSVGIKESGSADKLDSGTVTFNGVALTRVRPAAGTGGQVYIYELENPAVGTHAIVVGFETGACQAVCWASSWVGVDLTVARSHTSSGNINSGPDALAITGSSAGTVTLDYIGSNDNAAFTNHVSQTLLGQGTNGTEANAYLAASYKVNASTMNWTWAAYREWDHSAITLTGLAVADTTAPILSSPTASATSTTTATATVSTDEANGTLYTLFSTNATETASTIRSSGQSQAVTATGVQTVNKTGLTASTTYYAHHVHDDAVGTPNVSNVVHSASFATPAAGDTTPPTLSSPTALKTGSTTATGTVTTNDGTGVLRYYVSANASESQATLLASGTTQAVTATGVQNVSKTGLTPSSTVRFHYMHTDPSGNQSTVWSSATITLDAAPSGGSFLTNQLVNRAIDPTSGQTGGVLQASQAGWEVCVHDNASGALIGSKVTGLSTNSLGKLAISNHAGTTAGTVYRLDYYNTVTGMFGVQRATAA